MIRTNYVKNIERMLGLQRSMKNTLKNMIMVNNKNLGIPRIPKAFNNKINIGLIKNNRNASYPTLWNKFNLNPISDNDGDGVINAFDCRPFDMRRQDVKPNKLQQERIRKLPIYISNSKSEYNLRTGNNLVPLENAPKEQRNKVYSILKKYPTVTSSIEKSKPRAIVFTKNKLKDEEGEYQGFAMRSSYGRVEEHKNAGRGVAFVSLSKEKKQYSIHDRFENAKTSVHELKHVRQHQRGSEDTVEKKLFKGRYEQRKGEIQARREEENLSYKNAPTTVNIVRKLNEEENNPSLARRLKKYKEAEQKVTEKNYQATFKD